LAVERFRGDGLIRGRAVLYSDAERPQELRQHAYHYWVEPPTDMLQEQLLAWLRAANVARRVVTPEMRLRPDYLVTGRLLRFERVLGSGAQGALVEVRLILKDVAGERVLWTETYRQDAEAPGDEVSEAVAAFNAALGELFARFVADIPH
jgi:ABC-type uncharacterized transport system auxiliary subunit